MKWFADDYVKDRVKNPIKIFWGSLHRYEIFHVQTNSSWHPSWDLYETDQELIMLVEVAGSQEADVEINVGRECVQMRGSRCRPSEQGVTRIHHMEIDFGSYSQTIALPEPVEPDGVTSKYRDGFLVIRLPKELKDGGSNR